MRNKTATFFRMQADAAMRHYSKNHTLSNAMRSRYAEEDAFKATIERLEQEIKLLNEFVEKVKGIVA